MIKLLFILIPCALLCWGICAVPKSAEEQRIDDEAQLQWIKEYRNKRSMVKH